VLSVRIRSANLLNHNKRAGVTDKLQQSAGSSEEFNVTGTIIIIYHATGEMSPGNVGGLTLRRFVIVLEAGCGLGWPLMEALSPDYCLKFIDSLSHFHTTQRTKQPLLLLLLRGEFSQSLCN
jgi:hypothetical protein